VALRQSLADVGVRGGLQSHDYLFLPGATGKAEDAAHNAFRVIQSRLQGDARNIRVLYLGEDGKIYQVAKNPKGELVNNLIGDKLPN
jgi:hypothetical protein